MPAASALVASAASEVMNLPLLGGDVLLETWRRMQQHENATPFVWGAPRQAGSAATRLLLFVGPRAPSTGLLRRSRTHACGSSRRYCYIGPVSHAMNRYFGELLVLVLATCPVRF